MKPTPVFADFAYATPDLAIDDGSRSRRYQGYVAAVIGVADLRRSPPWSRTGDNLRRALNSVGGSAVVETRG